MIESRLSLSALLRSALLLVLIAAPLFAQTVPLDKLSHIHGLAASAEGGGAIYLATHEGLFLAQEDGSSERLSETREDLMSLAAHPTLCSVHRARPGLPAAQAREIATRHVNDSQTHRYAANGKPQPPEGWPRALCARLLFRIVTAMLVK